MDDDPDKLNAYVDDLLQDQRPEARLLPSEEALRARQLAALLRAARPGASLPRPDFVERMQRLIERVLREQPASPTAERRLSRRLVVLSGLGGIAAGVLATLGVERFARPPEAPTARTLVDHGTWTPVGWNLVQLSDRTPVAFRSGAIEGFLIRNGERVTALSAVCTHMGCILNWRELSAQFECPCHGATFTLAGHPSGTGEYANLPSLPMIDVRVTNGRVDVYSV